MQGDAGSQLMGLQNRARTPLANWFNRSCGPITGAESYVREMGKSTNAEGFAGLGKPECGTRNTDVLYGTDRGNTSFPANRTTRTTRYSGNSGLGNRTADHSPAPGVNNSRHQNETWSPLRSLNVIIRRK
jgi:hypothetical protein